MDGINREKYRKIIQKQLEETRNTIGSMRKNDNNGQDRNSPTELSNYDNHPAEMATELFQQEMSSALQIHAENIEHEMEDALKRIDDGTYGICAHCGEEISPERLDAMPYAKLCVKCEEKAEDRPEKKYNIRPNEEKIWDAPFGRKYLNKREDDENEGEDQLNDLMKYGSSDTPQDLGGYNDYEEFYTNEIDNQGIVDDMDKISNEQYKKQLP